MKTAVEKIARQIAVEISANWDDVKEMENVSGYVFCKVGGIHYSAKLNKKENGIKKNSVRKNNV